MGQSIKFGFDVRPSLAFEPLSFWNEATYRYQIIDWCIDDLPIRSSPHLLAQLGAARCL